jgi:hypothetical protein
MKMTREGKQGSVAKRWSRRTRRNVEVFGKLPRAKGKLKTFKNKSKH